MSGEAANALARRSDAGVRREALNNGLQDALDSSFGGDVDREVRSRSASME